MSLMDYIHRAAAWASEITDRLQEMYEQSPNWVMTIVAALAAFGWFFIWVAIIFTVCMALTWLVIVAFPWIFWGFVIATIGSTIYSFVHLYRQKKDN